jgi:hypothetical protein
MKKALHGGLFVEAMVWLSSALAEIQKSNFLFESAPK